MLYWLVDYLQKVHIFGEKLRVMKYISSRAAAALMLAFIMSLIIGPKIIRKLKGNGLVDSIRKIKKEGSPDLFEMHHKKQGTPTMGGLIIIFSFLIPILLLCNLNNSYTQIIIIMTLGFGAIGFYDDYTKKMMGSKGIPARKKLYFQLILGFLLGLFLYKHDIGIYYHFKGVHGDTYLSFPFLKNLYPDLGILYIPFVMLVLVASSNAVNLTDGLDGLAIGTTVIVAGAFMVIAYLVTRSDYARYLIVPFISNGGELVIVLGALVGAGLGFLWFNSHPAQIFMGDTGSLTLGGILGTVAILLKMEFLLVLIGGIFVAEALSVIIQVTSYKRFGKRVFLMTPIHHHFERKGWHESKIIIRFWIIGALLALFGLATLKLR